MGTIAEVVRQGLCTGCGTCAGICPTEAIVMGEDGKLLITEDFCIYCGACQEVCPENAIKVERRRLLHTDVQSGAWVIALEKLTSLESLIKDLRSKSRTRRSARIKSLVGDQQK